jgi:hypothetical protein
MCSSPERRWWRNGVDLETVGKIRLFFRLDLHIGIRPKPRCTDPRSRGKMVVIVGGLAVVVIVPMLGVEGSGIVWSP